MAEEDAAPPTLATMLGEVVSARRAKDSARLVPALLALGRHFEAQGGKAREALASYAEAVRALREAAGGEATALAEALEHMAGARSALREDKQSEEALAEAVALRERAQGEEHADLAGTLNQLAMARYAQGRADEAIAAYRRAIAVREAALGPRHETVAGLVGNLGNVLGEQRRFDEALECFQRVLAIQREAAAGGEDGLEVAMTQCNIGRLRFTQDRHEDALECLREALRIQRAAEGGEHAAATTLGNIAAVQREIGLEDDAYANCEEALAIFTRLHGGSEESPQAATALFNMGLARMGQKRPRDVQPLWRRAHDTFAKTLGEAHPRTESVAHMLKRLDIMIEMADEEAAEQAEVEREEAEKAKAEAEAGQQQ